MSGEFADFIETNPYVDPLVNREDKDLVWYEWNEFYLYRKDHNRKTCNEESLNMQGLYALSPDTRIRKLSRAIHRKDLPNPEDSQEVNLILFYKNDTMGMFFLEVSDFIYQCLLIIADNSPDNVISRICKTYLFSEEEAAEAKGIAEEFLNYLLKNEIIVPCCK
jgi:hypothetical protein